MTPTARSRGTIVGKPVPAPHRERLAMMRPTIVLDKNFLQGSSAKRIRELSASHRLLMPDVLFYELLSSSEPGRSRCFAKLPKVPNPVELIMHVGGLLRLEIDTYQPSGKPSSHCLDIHYQFNPSLSLPQYNLPPEAKEVLTEQTEELRSDVSSFISGVRHMPTFFPNLLTGSDADRRAAKNEAERVLVTDSEALLEFYAQLQAPPGERPLPPVEQLTPEWALFRWLQVQMLFALDIYCRYGGQIPDIPIGKLYEKIEHDVLDAQYLILGVLEGSFATREKKLQRWWAVLCPSGTLHA